MRSDVREDIILEISRMMREVEANIITQIAAAQLGELYPNDRKDQFDDRLSRDY